MIISESVSTFNKMPLSERKEVISKYSAKQLLSAYDYFGKNFCPVDLDFCESYEAIKAEILKRCDSSRRV